MKIKHLLLTLFCAIIFSCEDNTDNNDNNPCLINKSVNYTLNLNLPLYADLPSNGLSGIFIKNSNAFIKGVYVRIIGSEITALELAEPNDCTNVCDTPSSLTSEGFFEYTCGEKTVLYDVSGVKKGAEKEDARMRRYNTRLENNILTISN